MTNQHPITPPPELVEQWWQNAIGKPEVECVSCVAHQAARWGADHELEACCEWFVRDWTDIETADRLRVARRRKPPSLKEQALELVRRIKGTGSPWAISELDTIRRALEALPND